MPRYHFELTAEEREDLIRELHSKSGVRALKAQALLLMDEGPVAGKEPKEIKELAELGLSEKALRNLKKKVCEQGIDEALERKEYDGKCRPIKFDGAFEARITTLACSAPPEGYNAWTLRLLADKAVEAGYVDSVSTMTIQRILKKKRLNRTNPNIGKSPPQEPTS